MRIGIFDRNEGDDIKQIDRATLLRMKQLLLEDERKKSERKAKEVEDDEARKWNTGSSLCKIMATTIERVGRNS